MPRKGDGQSLKDWKGQVWFGSTTGANPGVTVEVEVRASNLVGAAGRSVRVARKLAKGRFDTCTVNVEQKLVQIVQPGITSVKGD